MPETKMIHPETDSIWVDAKRGSPRRAPYSDEELKSLRIRYYPSHLDADHHPADAVVIWTLLDMLEEQRGWKLSVPSTCFAWVDGSPGPAGGWRCQLVEGHSGPHSAFRPETARVVQTAVDALTGIAAWSEPQTWDDLPLMQALKRLRRIDDALASEDVPEGLWKAMDDSEDPPESNLPWSPTEQAWRWFRQQFGPEVKP